MITNDQIEVLERMIGVMSQQRNESEIAALRAAIADLKRLPETADGVRVVPGMVGWTILYRNGKPVEIVRAIVSQLPSAVPVNEPCVTIVAAAVYSTRESAEAARKECPACRGSTDHDHCCDEAKKPD